MNRRTLLLGLVSLGIFTVLFYLYGGHQTPNGQRPLIDLNSVTLNELKEEFNGDHSQVRMLALLSPT